MNDCFWALLIQSGRNDRKNRDVSRTIIGDVFSTKWNILDEAFCKNSCLYLTVDYFCKTLHITCFTGSWICLDETKQGCNLWKFYFRLYFIFKFITLPWDINHKLKICVLHFKLIHPCSWIQIILVSHYLPVQTHHNGKEIERKLSSIVPLT